MSKRITGKALIVSSPSQGDPKKVRNMQVNSEIVTFIRTLREEHPRMEKEKINLLKIVQDTKD